MRFVLAIIALLLLFSAPAVAADLIRLDGNGQTTVRADQITNNDLDKTILAEGEVEIKRGGSTLYADRVLVNTETMLADAMGNVRFTTANEVLRGSRMVADLNTGLGKVYQARIYNYPTGFYLNGQEIERVGEELYRVKDGSITSCDGELPPWQFSASEINLEVEGYATSYNTTFEILGVPAAWSPWLIFPVKTQRQSGLLFPEFGYSDRDGIKWSQSYFQTLGESQDLTLSANIMSKRGVDWGIEYRYSLNADSKGMFMLDFMPEDRMGESLYLDGSNAEAYNSRYWLRGKADHQLAEKTTLKLDLDIVSDRDFTDEFDFKETGYHPTRSRFLNWFRRDIDSERSLTRVNLLNLNHLREDESLNLGVRYTDRLDALDVSTLQDYPKLTWDMARRSIADSPVYFQMDSVYNYLYRREGSKGQILDMAPALALPLNFKDYLMLEPRVTWKPHLYDLERVEKESMNNTGFTNDVNVSVDASTYLFSVYDLSDEKQDMMLKHAMRPKISYSYQSGLSGDDLPTLITRREYKYHRISYGLDNSLTLRTVPWERGGGAAKDADSLLVEDDYGNMKPDEPFSRAERMDDNSIAVPVTDDKSRQVTGRGNDQSMQASEAAPQFDWYGSDDLGFLDSKTTVTAQPQAQEKENYDYVEFLRLNLAHAFYVDPYVEDYTLEEREWGNLEGRLEITPFNDYRLNLIVDTSWDVYRTDFDEISVLVATRNQRGDLLSLDYSNRAYDILNPRWSRYDDRSGRTHQVSGTAHVNIAHGFSVTYTTRYDIERSRRFENTVALNYKDQCWGISFIFHEDEREQGYYVAFDLAGLNFGR